MRKDVALPSRICTRSVKLTQKLSTVQAPLQLLRWLTLRKTFHLKTILALGLLYVKDGISFAGGIWVGAALGVFAALAAGVQVLARWARPAKALRGGHTNRLIWVIELQHRHLRSVYASGKDYTVAASPDTYSIRAQI